MLQEWLRFVIDLLEVLLSWPVAVTFLVVLFHHQIRQVIPTLGERLQRVSMGGNTIHFESAQRGYSQELQNINREKIPEVVRTQGETVSGEDETDQMPEMLDSFVDEVPTIEDTDEGDSTILSIEEELIALKQRLDEMNER